MNRRTCKRCGFSKPLNAQNFRHTARGFHYSCKLCARAYERAAYQRRIVLPVQAQRAAARERGLLLIAEFRRGLEDG